MEITFHLSQKFCLFSVEFCFLLGLFFITCDFISHIKCIFQQWNIFYCIPDSKIKWVAVALCQQTFFIQFLDLCSNPIFGSSHGQISIMALPTGILNFKRFIRSSTSLRQMAIVSAFVWATGIRPFSNFWTHHTRMRFQILYQDEVVPSNLLRHMCGKLKNLKLESNAVLKIASTWMKARGWSTLVLRYLMLTGWQGLWGRAFRVEGILLTSGFCTCKIQSYLYLSFFCNILMPLACVIKVTFKINNRDWDINCLTTHYFRGREITKNLGAQCWRYMRWITTWMFRFMFRLILLGYLQPVHLGDQSHLILGLDHHQPSPRTPFVSFVSYAYFDKN